MVLTAALPLSLLALCAAWSPARQGFRLTRPPLTVTVIDVGEGDSILVETPSGRTMLIDGGGSHGTRGDSRSESDAESRVGEKVVVPLLRREGISEINVLVMTHPHGDHIGGLAAVVRDMPVDSALDGDALPYPSAGYAALCRAIHARHIPDHPARRGETIDFGDGVRAEFLNPPADNSYGEGLDDKTVNNYSAVLRITYGKRVILLDGDAEVEAEDNMLAAYPRSYLRGDVLKTGHHGSRNASSDEWLDAVAPADAVISCGRNNPFLHPHPETLARLAAHHIRTLETDRVGNVTITTDGDSLDVESEKDPPAR